jgi:hypothetical protein
MSYRIPGPVRENFDYSGQFRNPAATVPLPAPKDMPVSVWFGGVSALRWTAAAAPNFLETTWASPIFDLRPDLRGLQPGGSTGRARNNNGLGSTSSAVPIWNNSAGRESRDMCLHVQIVGLRITQTAQTAISCSLLEFGHVSDPGQVQQITPPYDITSQLTGENLNSVLLNFNPYGEGRPARYWQCRLHFVRYRAVAGGDPNGPPYQITGAYY